MTEPLTDTRSDAPTSPIATLFPGYFALVMATGIIAIAAGQQDLGWLGDALYVIAAVGYLVLVVLLALRIIRFPRLVATDLTSHAKGFAFLTIVAGTNVLGSASALIHGWWGLAWALWWASLGLWAILVYVTVVAVVIKAPKPALSDGINGTWFLLIVSTQSVAVLGALLLGRGSNDLLAFICLAAFVLGIVLYFIVMTLVFLRWSFSELDPPQATPPAWIAAGAVAITVLAGSNLLGARDASTQLDRVAPFIEGMVVLAWATATFWFPLMIAMGIWRHIVRRFPLRYHPSYWALVFPLGMYAAASFRMRTVIQLDALGWLPTVAFWIALVAWTATFLGLVHLGWTAIVARRPWDRRGRGCLIPIIVGLVGLILVAGVAWLVLRSDSDTTDTTDATTATTTTSRSATDTPGLEVPPEEPDPRDAIRAVLTAAGITGAGADAVVDAVGPVPDARTGPGANVVDPRPGFLDPVLDGSAIVTLPSGTYRVFVTQTGAPLDATVQWGIAIARDGAALSSPNGSDADFAGQFAASAAYIFDTAPGEGPVTRRDPAARYAEVATGAIHFVAGDTVATLIPVDELAPGGSYATQIFLRATPGGAAPSDSDPTAWTAWVRNYQG